MAVALVALCLALAGTGAGLSMIADGSVDTAQLHFGAVTNPKVANGAVGELKLRNGAVTSQKIRNGSIEAADLNWRLWKTISATERGPTGPTGPTGPGVTPCSGQWSSTSNQNAGLNSATTAITYSTQDVTPCSGLSVQPGLPAAAILVTLPGRYNLQFSAQTEKTTNGTDTMWIWMQTATWNSGASTCGTFTDLPDPASGGRGGASGDRTIMTVNVLFDVTAGMCIRLAMTSTATINPAELRLLAEAAVVSPAPRPAVPSIITNIWRIG